MWKSGAQADEGDVYYTLSIHQNRTIMFCYERRSLERFDLDAFTLRAISPSSRTLSMLRCLIARAFLNKGSQVNKCICKDTILLIIYVDVSSHNNLSTFVQKLSYEDALISIAVEKGHRDAPLAFIAFVSDVCEVFAKGFAREQNHSFNSV